MDPTLAALGIRLLGAVAGTVLALVFQPPKTLPDFVTRSIFSLIAGMVFSSPVRDYLRWAPSVEIDIASGALTSLAAWPLMGAAVKAVGKWRQK